MPFIEVIGPQAARGRLAKIYKQVSGPGGQVDNVLQIHSLRPHSLEGHMTLYKYVLHHPRNTVPKWFLEVIGVCTSILNRCDYCVEHHYAGVRRLVGDDTRSSAMRTALETGEYHATFNDKESAALEYVRRLTCLAHDISAIDVHRLGEIGWDDGEILEINQVTAYFNYANRTVLGLGVSTEGDILGLSPGDSDDAANWEHR